ncbi:transcriptional regulator with XRE-family HTH domain [Dyadobacter sp. BE34]|uniref:Transcriptional regulator with XRE-family HTH domain n=1 Tax=Dyadobacter fermentans TaxID=94254 RepID=A0ABU1QRT8_9BACT|nr:MULTISPECIES: helix-turn-helix transcriptional regulator [Dyadobacter]MDR6803732.1 transcriptional regulator with XRE-family HTH domain [Dyadobacter fermentans]MDR7041472.1 transcriptional regulator with XRE-family HTH domain [Dyadobacter sp. BE242]MDR7195876.1 transcriptional regulator with XRE-family HTH domain [Dyadobacter sp. BE34]MDR7213580.1 transcriptional regulator with XRE-family HTH domain [Dyadobacter sp. BE31]MDR7261282.1 transcriptional regulator with XRE-family HTH domain [Dya
MVKSKHQLELNEPNIKRILDAGRIETELECEQVTLAKRYLRLHEENLPDLGTTIKALSNLIIEFEDRRWSDRSLITDAQIEESDAAVIQAEKEYVFIRQRRNLILAKLQELSLKQKDLALLLNHSKSYTSELLNGVRPFSTNDLKLIHLLFEIPLTDLIITIPSQETLSRLETAIDKISSFNPKAKLLRETLANRPVAKGFLPDNWDEEDAEEETEPEKHADELTLSNK